MFKKIKGFLNSKKNKRDKECFTLNNYDDYHKFYETTDVKKLAYDLLAILREKISEQEAMAISEQDITRIADDILNYQILNSNIPKEWINHIELQYTPEGYFGGMDYGPELVISIGPRDLNYSIPTGESLTAPPMTSIDYEHVFNPIYPLFHIKDGDIVYDPKPDDYDHPDFSSYEDEEDDCDEYCGDCLNDHQPPLRNNNQITKQAIKNMVYEQIDIIISTEDDLDYHNLIDRCIDRIIDEFL